MLACNGQFDRNKLAEGAIQAPYLFGMISTVECPF